MFFRPHHGIKDGMRFLIATLLICFLSASCANRPAVITDDMTPMEFIQRGQEASDRNRFSLAMQYYEALIERFPTDIDSVIAAEYEIAFIHYKQNRFDIARSGFNELLERYDTPDEALLPPQFKILSNIVLARMNEIEIGGRHARFR